MGCGIFSLSNHRITNMNSIKKLLQQWLTEYHPFTLVLYLTALSVAMLLLFKLGVDWGGSEVVAPVEQREELSAPQVDLQESNSATVNAWDLPSLSMQDTQGVTHTISDWKGKTILLNFWATWCPPCKREIPEFIEYQQTYGKDRFQIIGVGIDEPERIIKETAAMQINYPVLLATDAEMMSHWGNHDQVLPYSVVIDRSGIIRYIHRGQLMPSIFEQTIKPIIFE